MSTRTYLGGRIDPPTGFLAPDSTITLAGLVAPRAWLQVGDDPRRIEVLGPGFTAAGLGPLPAGEHLITLWNGSRRGYLIAQTTIRVRERMTGRQEVRVGDGGHFATLREALDGTTGPQDFVLTDGDHTVADIPPDRAGFTIRSASGDPSRCRVDGRGGIGAGHRLSWGKGGLHVRAPGLIEGVGFVRCGGGDGRADGEAGVYAEGFAAPGELVLRRCAFDGNENGVFVPSYAGPGAGVALRIDDCRFGFAASNGASGDGLAHDVYANGPETVIANTRFAGCAGGNTIKSRSSVLRVLDCDVPARAGRAIDFPEAGRLVVRGGRIFSVAGANANLIGFGNENQAGWTGVQPELDGVELIISRFEAAIWLEPAACVLDLSRCTVTRADPFGAAAASLRLVGAGRVAGLPDPIPAAAAFPEPRG